MLLRAIFLCFAIALLSETLLHAAASLALSVFRRQGVAAARTAYDDATQQAQAVIAAALAAGNTPPALIPSPSPTCALTVANNTCALWARAAIVVASASPSACRSGSCTLYLQANDLVRERRTSVSIGAVVTNASGDVIASRTGSVVFRTMLVAPYAIPVANLDATLDDVSSPGDIGGVVPSDSTTGTLIDVVYRNAQTGAMMPANVWTGFVSSQPLTSSWSP
jgi:hypothetical protein